MDHNWLDSLTSRAFVTPTSRTASPVRGPQGTPSSSGPTFADVLSEAQKPTEVRFSAHAMSRLQQRGMVLSQDDLKQLGAAVDQAGKKGARDAYLVYGNTGFVVNVPNRTVVTAMMNEGGTMVTNIDSVVFVQGPDR